MRRWLKRFLHHRGWAFYPSVAIEDAFRGVDWSSFFALPPHGEEHE